MSQFIVKTVKSEIQERKLLEKGATIVLGISGGVDSCVLLDILARCGDYKIVLAHINHGLRETALRDEAWVRNRATYYDLDLDVLSCNIQKLSKKRKESLETSGRYARYRFFKEAAVKHGAKTIVTAHTADDQIETLVMNYVRGALERGLRGIAWRRQLEFDSHLYVARPLLSVWKKEIYEYALKNKIKYHEDETNWDTTFVRNRIRHKVVAKLDEAAKKEIWLGAEKFRNQEFDREQKILKIFKESVRIHKDKLFLKSKVLLNLPQELQHRLIEKICQHVLQRGDFLLLSKKFNSIERVLGSHKAHSMLEIQIGLFLHKQYDELCVTDHNLFMQKTFSYRWNFGGPLRIRETDYVIVAEVKEAREISIRDEVKDDRRRKKFFTMTEHTEYFDADLVGKSVIVRNRKDGDRIKPCGMRNQKKIKKILIDSKTPLEMRNKLPIVASEDGNTVWVAGMCISDDYKIGKNTRHILKLTLKS